MLNARDIPEGADASENIALCVGLYSIASIMAWWWRVLRIATYFGEAYASAVVMRGYARCELVPHGMFLLS